jgi:hypothetical protein
MKSCGKSIKIRNKSKDFPSIKNGSSFWRNSKKEIWPSGYPAGNT